MKRFLLFAGDAYYPSGAAADFVADYDSLEEAATEGRSARQADDEEYSYLRKYDWYNVLDHELGTWDSRWFQHAIGDKYPGYWT